MTKPEPLRGKKTKRIPQLSVECLNLGMCYMHEDVKSAVEFYKKYKYEPFMLLEDRLDIATKVANELGFIWERETSERPFKYTRKYNDWLFDYCFGDVIE